MSSIFDQLLKNQELETFVTGLQISGLDQQLKGNDAFTVFAPNYRAFTSLPMLTLQKLSQEIKFLTKVLRKHIISGKFEHPDLLKLRRLNQKNTAETVITSRPLNLDLLSGIKIEDATVLSVDISPDNGIIYIIDRVFLPY
jgi:uncharacterized surface protein with fasciclin (FAS1) repeats